MEAAYESEFFLVSFHKATTQFTTSDEKRGRIAKFGDLKVPPR